MVVAAVNVEAQPPPPENTEREYNLKFFNSVEGLIRIIEAILAVVTLILLVAGYCENTTGRYGAIMFVLIVTLIESFFIMFIMVMRYDETITAVDVPLTLLLNDGILCLFLFIVTNLSLMSIGSCPATKGARLMAALFLVALFILLVVQNYFNYLRWQDRRNAQISSKSSETTVTESSSTVLS